MLRPKFQKRLEIIRVRYYFPCEIANSDTLKKPELLNEVVPRQPSTVVGEICRNLGITEATFYRWKKTYAGLDLGELRELRQLREENRRLKGVVADLTLDKTILREALGKKW